MKRIVLVMIGVLAIILLDGCRSAKVEDRGPYYCDGGDFLFHQDLITKDPNFSPRDPLFAAPTDVIQRWNKDKQISPADAVYMVKKDKSSSYFRIKKGCNRTDLNLVQFSMDKAGKITSPIRFLNGNLPVLSRNNPSLKDEKAFTPSTVIRTRPWAVMAYPVVDSSHAKSKYDASNMKISWDLAEPVLEVIAWRNSKYEALHYPVALGQDFTMINGDAKYVQLLIQSDAGNSYFLPNENTDLINLKAIKNFVKADPAFLLEIQPLAPISDTANKSLPLKKMVVNYRGDCPYQGGCVPVLVSDMRADHEKMQKAGKSPTLYQLCLADGDVDESTSDTDTIRVGWDYLTWHSTQWLIDQYIDQIWR